MAVRDDFSAGEVLAAADLNDTFASKVDYATPTNAQTGTAYTFVADDAERLTTASNGSAVTFTIPPQSSVTWGDDTILRVVNYGAGAVTIDGGSGVTVTNTATTVAQYQAAAAIRTGSDAWTLVPFAGGGEIPAAEISSPAATGQYTDTGVTYDYYTFTASGTLTVDTAGFADILVIAGGGGTKLGNTYIAGGGAGGMLELTDAYLGSGTLTVTVGAGGTTSSNNVSNRGSDSKLDTFVAVGGGGGSGSNSSAFVNYGDSGGSGGGGSGGSGVGGAGVTNQGNAGGGVTSGFAGGGGAGGAASGSTAGIGKASSITGSSVTYAAGGASSGTNTANTGDGGQGAAAGNSGVVIVRVKV